MAVVSVMEATEELWPGFPLGVFQRPHGLLQPKKCAKQVRVSPVSFSPTEDQANQFCVGTGQALEKPQGPATEDSYERIRGTRNGSSLVHPPAARQFLCASVRHIVIEGKQRPLSPGHRLPNRIEGRFSAFSSLIT